MDGIWTQILMALLGLVTGDIVMRIFFRSERQKAAAAAQKEENDMWHERLREQREANRDLNQTISDLTEQLRGANSECADKTQHIRKLNGMLLAEQEKNLNYERLLASRERFIAWLRTWHCAREDNKTRSGCTRRKPRQPFPMRYDPPSEMEHSEEDGYKAEINVNVNSNLKIEENADNQER